MNFKYISLVFVLAFGTMQSAIAQQIPTLNQYIFNPYSYNPATAGSSTVANLYLNYRRQWNNMPGAPLMMLGTYDMPVSKGSAGVGAQLGAEKSGLNTNIGGKLSYAYHLPLNKDKSMKLSFGLSAGFFTQQFDYARINASEQNDNTLAATNDASATAFTADAGVNFNWNRLNIGVALPQLLNANNLRTNSYIVGTNAIRSKLASSTLITARYVIGDKDGITVEPIVMARLTQKLEPQFDFAALASWKQILFVGGGYRSANGFSNLAGFNGTVGVRLAKRALLSYTVESLLTPGDNYATPLGLTHDILFGYRFGDISKEDGGMEKVKEVFKGLEEQLAKTNGRLDSASKAADTRMVAIENKPISEAADKSKVDVLESRIATLNGRLTQADQKIAELEKRPATTTTVREVSGNNSGSNTVNYPVSGTPINLGNSTKIQTVYFAVNSAVLDAKAQATLRTVANTLANMSSTAVYLNGTASQEGGKDRNMLLSMERTASVITYLKKIGVTQTILTTSAGNAASKAAVRKDRSVEIYTLGN